MTALCVTLEEITNLEFKDSTQAPKYIYALGSYFYLPLLTNRPSRHLTFFGCQVLSEVDIAQLEAISAPERQATEPVALHAVSEWPADRKSLFQQAPILDQRVTAGLLPSVDQRLPDNPLVIHPAHQMEPYGGTWPRYGTSPSDVGIFHHRLGLRWSGPLGSNGTRDITQPALHTGI